MRFEFATATRIIFGRGTLKEIGPIAGSFGSRALLVTGSNTQRAEPLTELLGAAKVDCATFPVAGEPDIAAINAGVALAREERCELVIACGGGSAIDAGKAIAAMLANEGELLDYLEVIGRGRALAHPSAPFIAIPTTSGTGAEVTRNAVLALPEHRVKVSLRSPLMLPRVALVDPELTFDLPPSVTASTGLDALTQLIEPLVSCRANPMVDALCREGIQCAARSLRKAFHDGHDASARENMALASLFGGLALANAGLGAVHGFAGPIGGMFPAPHGAVCAALLPHVMQANKRALDEREPNAIARQRCDEIARIITGRTDATAGDAITWAAGLVAELGIPKLSAYGIRHEHIPELVEKSEKASSMKGNPIPLTREELAGILEQAIRFRPRSGGHPCLP